MLRILFFLSISAIAQDLFKSEQWYLKNHGGESLKKLDFHTLLPSRTLKNFDVKASSIADNKSKLGRDVIVAVIDSGVSYLHPDLKKSILKNEIECDENGNPRYLGNKDLDNNGYPGDCVGWNFASLTDSEIEKFLKSKKFKNLSPERLKSFKDELIQMRRRPLDRDGHGTHIAGIMAAHLDNKIGIAGLSEKIKILPIKVYDDPNHLTSKYVEVEAGSLIRKKPLSKVIAQAFRYAIKRKVDVINISIGWNKLSHDRKLEDIIKEAISRGIVVVTAAGNNGTNDDLFPCRIDGVFCVGATNAYGYLSEISNYGKNVDFLAPGERIFSLYPVDVNTLDFPISGYEYLSGTSQAAPFISAASALLKSQNENLNVLDIKKILLNSSTEVLHSKNQTISLGHMVNFEKIFNFNDGQSVFPNFKKNQKFTYDPKKESIIGKISFENLSSLNSEVNSQINIEELSFIKNVNLNLKPYESIDVLINIKVENSKLLENTLTLNFLSEGKDLKISYPIVKNLDISKNENKELDQAASKILNKSVDRLLRPVIGNLSKSNEYYSIEVVKDGIEIHFFKEDKESLDYASKVFLEHAVRVSSVTKLDSNSDGKEDYLIFSVHQKTDESGKVESFWNYSYFDQNLSPLYGERSVFRHIPPLATFLNEYAMTYEDLTFTLVRELKDLTYYSSSINGVGKIKLPIFRSARSIAPIYQQRKNSFSKINTKEADHIFYLKHKKNNGVDQLIAYSIFDKGFIKQLTGKKFLSKSQEVIGPFISNSCNNCSEFFILWGDGFYRKMSKVLIKENLDIELSKVEVSLDGFGKFLMSSIHKFGNITSNFIHSIRSNSELSLFNNDGTWRRSSRKIENYSRKVFLSALDTNTNEKYKFYLEGEDLVVHKNDVELGFKKVRRHFTNNENALYSEVFVQVGEVSYPALFKDALKYTDDGYQVLVATENGIRAPLDLSFRAPRGCKRLNTRFDKIDQLYKIPFLCWSSSTKQYKLSLFPLKI